MVPRRTPPRVPLPKPRAAAAPLTPHELQRKATKATNKARLAALSIPTLGGAIRDDDDDDDDNVGGSDRGGGGGGGSWGLKRKTRGGKGGGKGAGQGGYSEQALDRR
jgi:hypothetical protein